MITETKCLDGREHLKQYLTQDEKLEMSFTGVRDADRC